MEHDEVDPDDLEHSSVVDTLGTQLVKNMSSG